MTPSEADQFIRACATFTWLALSLFLLALALHGRRDRDD